MAFLLPSKPRVWTPDGHTYPTPPTVPPVRVRLQGGCGKIWGGATVILEFLVGDCIVDFTPVPHMAEPVSYQQRVRDLISFVKDNEDEMLDLAEKADAASDKFELEKEEFEKKTTRQPRGKRPTTP